MSAPEVPGLGPSIGAVLRLSWLRLVRGRKLRLGGAAAVLVLVAAIAARYAIPDADAEGTVETVIRLGFFGLLVYLLPFLFTSGSVAEEVEARTLPYMMMRPAGRGAIALGKYIAGAGMSVAILVGSVIVLHIACYASEPGLMGDELGDSARFAGALALLALCYSAICLFWGSLVVEAAGLVSTLHLAAIEFGASFMPGPARLASMNYLSAQLAGLPRGGFLPELVPEVELAVAAGVVSAVTLVFLGFAWLVIGTREFGFGKA